MTPVVALVDPAAGLAGPDTLGAMRALVATVVVLALVGALAWLVRRGTLALPRRGPRPAIAVETAVPLGERRSLVVVTVEGRRLLLGLTPASVSLVTELAGRAPAFADAVDARVDRGPTPGGAA